MDGGEGANTGIAYGHYSQSGNTYASAFVNIPCATTYLNDGGEVMLPPQTGYIYSGGEADDLGDEQTDFGFQLNAPSGGGVPTSIQPYTHTYSSNTQGAPTGDTRLHLICDTDYTLTFYVGTTSDGLPELVLNYVGSTTAIVTPQNYSIVQVMTSSTLWRTSCTACRVKRMTTIAVPPTSPTNTVLATWLGVSDPFNLTREGPTAQTQWRNAQVAATYESTPQSWVDGFVVGSDSKSRGLAVVKKYDAANEDVGINESGAHVVARVRKSQ
jgi:hypothetical protein